MGKQHTVELAEAVADEKMDLVTALSMHLTVNLYPPLPLSYLPVAVRTLQAVSKIILDTEAQGKGADYAAKAAMKAIIPLPDGIDPLPNEEYLLKNGKGQLGIPAAIAVKILYLEPFCQI